MRALAHSAIDERFDELLSCLNSAEGIKTSSLERELVRIDDALEQIRRHFEDARKAVTNLGDDEFTAVCGDLTARLSEVGVTMLKMPVGPIEPDLLRLDINMNELLHSIRTAGTVIALRGVSARDVEVRGLPPHVRPGHPLQFELALSEHSSSRPSVELEVAAASLALHGK